MASVASSARGTLTQPCASGVRLKCRRAGWAKKSSVTWLLGGPWCPPPPPPARRLALDLEAAMLLEGAAAARPPAVKESYALPAAASCVSV